PGAGSADALGEIAASLVAVRAMLPAAGLPSQSTESVAEWVAWCLRLIEGHQPANGEPAASEIDASVIARLDAIADRAYSYAMEMDFQFLFDRSRKLFSIGYQHGAHLLDTSFYDLLASEARLASFIAIAKNDVPVDHWLHLDRTLTHIGGETALVSWSGSMFEYLMPALVMQTFPLTILDQTCRGALQRQIAYGNQRGVPWGVSESAYNLRDRHLTYQYRAFGVPDLALKRGLGRDLVIAPYASALAIMIEPDRALANLAVLEEYGALGAWGFRDALDFTRPAPDRRYAVVQSYMAHHIGMSFVAIANAVHTGIWQRRFHDDPMVRSAELLLHERIPRRLVWKEPPPDVAEALPPTEADRPAVREVETPDTPQPSVALLGHLPYTIMLSHCGSGYSRYEDLAVTRWRSDGTRDDTGQFCYVKNVAAGRVWSAAHQPVCVPADWYRALLAADRVTFHRADGPIDTRTEIAVVPQDSAEVRRVTLTNNGDESVDIEVTSYGEVVLALPAADRVHPAFGNLFVETEWHEWCTAITATRRPRSATERPLWCVHVVDTGVDRIGPVTCETDRARFLGRGRSVRDPVALERDGPLSMTTGAVLDPVFALRTRVSVDPGQSVSVAFTTIVADSRERAFQLADRYHHPHAAQRALDLAWTSTQVELRELGITPTDAAVFQELAGHLFFSVSSLRASQDELMENRGSQSLLWSNGISGDWPILLATISSEEGLPTLRQILSAHHYWRRRGMMVDLIVLNTHAPTYLQDLNDRISAAIFASADASAQDRPGGVFVRRATLLSEDDLLMLRATARVHLPCDGRSLARILDSTKTPGEPDELGLEPVGRPEAPRVPAQHSFSDTLALQRARLHTFDAQRMGLEARMPNGFAAPIGAPAGATMPDGSSIGAAVPASRARPTPSRGIAVLAPLTEQPPLLFDNGIGGLTQELDYFVRVAGDAIPPAPWVNVIANPKGGFMVSERGAGCTWAETSYFYRLTPWHNDPVSDPASEAIYIRDDDTGELWTATPAPMGGDTFYTVRHAVGASSFEHERDGIHTHLTMGIAEEEATKLSTLRITNKGRRRRSLTLTAFAEWTLGSQREVTQHNVKTSWERELGAIFAWNTFDPNFATWVAYFAVTERVTGHTADRREFIGRNGSLSAPFALGAVETPLAGSTGAGMDPCAALQFVVELKAGETRDVVVILGAADTEAGARRAVSSYREAR
ncbi:MAG: hypothetical protein H7138_24860, partial [Myxococcales bacterium]|nr:hypothetical protein [Myxococcales bacterium]